MTATNSVRWAEVSEVSCTWETESMIVTAVPLEDPSVKTKAAGGETGE